MHLGMQLDMLLVRDEMEGTLALLLVMLITLDLSTEGLSFYRGPAVI